MNPTVMYGRLEMSSQTDAIRFTHRAPRHEAVREIEAGKAIGDQIGQKVQRPVEEREQPDHAPEPRSMPFQPVIRRTGVMASVIDDEPQRPDAGVVGDLGERVGAEVAVDAPARPACANGTSAAANTMGLSTQRTLRSADIAQ